MTVVRDELVVLSVRVIDAPTTTLPDGSVIRPATLPVLPTCAARGHEQHKTKIKQRHTEKTRHFDFALKNIPTPSITSAMREKAKMACDPLLAV